MTSEVVLADLCKLLISSVLVQVLLQCVVVSVSREAYSFGPARYLGLPSTWMGDHWEQQVL